jgi:hypothetical protein
MSELLERQMRFARMVSRLLDHAHELGFDVTLGDAYRDPRVHGDVGVARGYGHARSCHKLRLAVDLNLFRAGRLLVQTEDHRPLGEWWEAHGGSWGGRFKPAADGNHYSLEYQGMR